MDIFIILLLDSSDLILQLPDIKLLLLFNILQKLPFREDLSLQILIGRLELTSTLLELLMSHSELMLALLRSLEVDLSIFEFHLRVLM